MNNGVLWHRQHFVAYLHCVVNGVCVVCHAVWLCRCWPLRALLSECTLSFSLLSTQLSGVSFTLSWPAPLSPVNYQTPAWSLLKCVAPVASAPYGKSSCQGLWWMGPWITWMQHDVPRHQIDNRYFFGSVHDVYDTLLVMYVACI